MGNSAHFENHCSKTTCVYVSKLHCIIKQWTVVLASAESFWIHSVAEG